MRIMCNENNQIIDILLNYLSYKHLLIFLMRSRELYKNKPSIEFLEKTYYTPSKSCEMYNAVDKWCFNRDYALKTLGHISRWNTMKITDMSYLFYKRSLFNDEIDDWIVYNVKDMKYMFYSATFFNKSINSWNVSNVQDMRYMFYLCISFDKDLNNWNTKNVNSMKNMFFCAKIFNKPIGDWNISNVVDMTNMLSFATKFNQNLKNWNINIYKIKTDNMFYETLNIKIENLPVFSNY